MSIWDLDNYSDFVKDAANEIEDVATSIADAGHLIGGILKTIAPVIAMYPGLGTAFSVAIYAAGAAAAGDNLTDAAIGTASSAMPPGLPRIAFDGGATLTKEIARGENIIDSTIETCRKVAKQSGPQAAAAFDAGVSAVKGGKIDQRAIDAGRAFALTTGGQASATSYDAGVSIAKGNKADAVVLDAARGYVRDMGGPLAAAAFDTGIAMGYGQTLQEAGYIGLQTYVKGNDPLEKILNFVDVVGRAESLGMALEMLLQTELAKDFIASIPSTGVSFTGPGVDSLLKPYVDEIKNNPYLMNIPAGELAKQFKVDEALIRAAQALMRSGKEDVVLKRQFYPPLTSIGKLDVSGYETKNRELRAKGRGIATKDPRVYALRMSVNSQDWIFGFDLGTGTCYDYTQWGPGQETVIKTANIAQSKGFKAAGDLQHLLASRRQRKITENVRSNEVMAIANSLGKVRLPPSTEIPKIQAARAAGSAIAATNATVMAARTLETNPDYQYGFDVATKVCQDRAIDGPGQQQYRAYMGPDYGGSMMRQRGFDVGQAIQFGITKQVQAKLLDLSGHPTIAAGQLGTSGLVNSNLSDLSKSNVMQSIVGNPAAAAGAQKAIDTHNGFWGKVKAFFGF